MLPNPKQQEILCWKKEEEDKSFFVEQSNTSQGLLNPKTQFNDGQKNAA